MNVEGSEMELTPEQIAEKRDWLTKPGASLDRHECILLLDALSTAESISKGWRDIVIQKDGLIREYEAGAASRDERVRELTQLFEATQKLLRFVSSKGYCDSPSCGCESSEVLPPIYDVVQSIGEILFKNGYKECPDCYGRGGGSMTAPKIEPFACQTCGLNNWVAVGCQESQKRTEAELASCKESLREIAHKAGAPIGSGSFELQHQTMRRYLDEIAEIAGYALARQQASEPK